MELFFMFYKLLLLIIFTLSYDNDYVLIIAYTLGAILLFWNVFLF